MCVGSLRILQVSSSVQPCPFLKMFWFCHNICCFDACHVVFALAVPLGVVFVSLVCPVPLCSCFLRSTTQRPDHTTPSADREKEFERDTQRERESGKRRSNENGEELACVTLFCLKDFPADSRGPRLLGQARRGTGLNVAEGAQKGSHPSGSARGSGGGSNDHSARAAGGNVEGGVRITWCLLVWIVRTALGQRSKQRQQRKLWWFLIDDVPRVDSSYLY